ncbi:MAG: TldD/PmbA family protein [Elusimicrobia bacterium]|nr:TldD/PmbA family protein [Elusimicrobiota bacterium]
MRGKSDFSSSPSLIPHPSSLDTLALEAVGWMKRENPALQSEVYLVRGQERSLEVREGQLETLQDRQYFGGGVRVVQEGRMGFAYAADLSLDSIQELFRTVANQIHLLPKDSFRQLPYPDQKIQPGSDRALRDTLWDPSLFSDPLLNKLEFLKQMESQAMQADSRIRRVVRLGYSESSGEVVVANTLGVQALEQGTYCEVGLSAVAEQGSEIQIGSSSQSCRFSKDLDFGRTARQASERAAVLLGSQKLPTRRRSVVFDPWVAGEFLDLMAQALCADQVQRGKSIFRGKMEKKVGSSQVQILDDPRRPKGLATSLFDDEGVPTRTKVLIGEGILKEFLYDTYTAAKDKRVSNGSANRASFKGTPSPGSSNFYLSPGNWSKEKLIQDTQDGILILDVMGMHMADSVSGEFSVGVSGVAIERGKITHGVKGAMISGTVLELLQQIDAVADDLTFYGSTGSPTFRVADLTVA